MTAGTEVVSNDVVRKVEIEEKRVTGLDVNEVGDADATVEGNVGGVGYGNVGGNGKDDSDDSSYVFVGGGIDVSAGDPADTGGANVDTIAVAPESDSAHEVDQFKNEELGMENGGITVDSLVLGTKGIDHGSVTVSDPDVKAVNKEVNLDNGSTVDPSVVLATNDIAQVVNGNLVDIAGEEEQVVKSNDEVDDANEIQNMLVQTDVIVPEVTFDPEPTLNPIETSQVTIFDAESTPKPPKESDSQIAITPTDLVNTTEEPLSTPNPVNNTDSETMVSDELESACTLIAKAECQVTVDGSDEPSEDSECKEPADVSGVSGSLKQEVEGEVMLDGSGKPSEDLECRLTADGQETSESRIEESVNGSKSIGSSLEDQEFQGTSDNQTEEVDPTITVMELDSKSEEHQELLAVNSEVSAEAEPNHVCGEIKAEHQSEPVSAPHPSENEEAKVIVIGSSEESEGNPDSGLVLPDVDAPANGQVKNFDGILETGGTQSSQKEADESAPLTLNAEKENSEEKLEMQVEEISEIQVKVKEAVESEANSEEMKEQVKTEDEIQEPKIEVSDNVQNESNLEDNTEQSANQAEASLESETNIEPLTHEDNAIQHEVSSCVDGTQEVFQPEESAEAVEILPSTDSVKSECKIDEPLVQKDNDSLSKPDELVAAEREVEVEAHLVTENTSAEGMALGTGIENVVVPDDEEKEPEVKDASVGDQSTLSFPDTYVNPAPAIEFGSIGRHETVPKIHHDVTAVPDVVNKETKPAWGDDIDNAEGNVDVSHGDRNSNKMSCPEVEDMEGIQSDDIQASSVEGSVSDVPDVQTEEADILPYNFLIRIPRYEDDTFRDQIRSAQLQVEEKTRLRDAVRVEIQSKRAKLRAFNEEFHAAKLEETAARRLVRLKRQEIDTVQSIINRMKNAISVDDIDARILNMEHMIQHETLLLKDEKQFIREIKQLKTLRDQLAANIGDEDEVQQALEQRDQIEDSLKTLRKELDGLKGKVSKAEAVVIAVGKKYDEESRKERELQAKFRAADDVRQKAYAHLNSLKKQAYDKNQNFRLYKDNVMAAKDFAARGDKDGLHRLCANQVEAFMEQWNNNDEFRKEYVSRCTMNATRRQRFSEAGSLVPDDVAVSVPPRHVNEKIDKALVSVPSEVESVSVAPPVKPTVSSDEKKNVDTETKSKSVEVEKNQTMKTKGAVGSEIAVVTEKKEAAENVKEEKDKIKATKEEMELARKAEELRKEEMAAKLKEQRRLEEKAKAAEALERKKRIAEKAQQRAELRARKEAEQKEKEREKRLRKKEKRKAVGDGGEDALSSENEAPPKEIEVVVKDQNALPKKKSAKPPPHFFSKQLKPKPVPPAIVNRNKKRWQQWGKAILAVVAVLCLFLLGNTGFFLNLKAPKVNGDGF